MRFSYNGNHPSVTFWGITFPQNVPVETDDAFVCRKLTNNSHFTQHFDTTETPKSDIVVVSDATEIDVGVTDTPLADVGVAEKANLLAYALEVHGVKLDGRMSVEKLNAKIAELEANVD